MQGNQTKEAEAKAGKHPLAEEITKEQWGHWKHHPITRETFRQLRKLRSEIVTHIANGGTLAGDSMKTAELTARAVGKLEGIDLLLNIESLDAEGNLHHVEE